MPDRLSQLRVVDEVLTNIARGYTNAELVGTQLFPVVSCNKEGGKIPQFSAEAFKIYNTERALRAKSNRISPDGRTTIDYVLTEHDLEYPMDFREIEEDIANLELHGTIVVSEGINLRLEKAIADLAQNLSTYPSGNKVTLGAGDKFTNTSSNPIAIIDAAKDAIRQKIGRYPNTGIIGASALVALKEHPAITDKIKYTQMAIVTTDSLSSLLGIKRLYVGSSVYSSDSGVMSDIWSDNFILAYVPEAQSNVERNYYEPAFAYTLRKKNYPVVDKYDEGGKLHVVRNTDMFVPKVVGSDAGYLINDTNA